MLFVSLAGDSHWKTVNRCHKYFDHLQTNLLPRTTLSLRVTIECPWSPTTSDDGYLIKQVFVRLRMLLQYKFCEAFLRLPSEPVLLTCGDLMNTHAVTMTQTLAHRRRTLRRLFALAVEQFYFYAISIKTNLMRFSFLYRNCEDIVSLGINLQCNVASSVSSSCK